MCRVYNLRIESRMGGVGDLAAKPEITKRYEGSQVRSQGRHDLGVEKPSRVFTRGCMPSSYAIV